jgi:hypothetical protein
MSSDNIPVELAGLRAEITSSFEEFTAYARLHLEPLLVSESESPAISATLRWHEGAPPERLAGDPKLRDMERVDRDLYRGDQTLAWFRIDEMPGLQLRFQWDGERLRVEGDYYYWLSADGKRDALKRLVYRRRLPALRQRRFTTLLYYLLYYPCFWWLERQERLHPIHAAGVEVDGGVIVLAGPSGVGKSTLSTGLASAAGAKLLSDTFLLHRDVATRPVREPLLLDAWSRSWIGDGADLLRPITWRYCLDRNGFHFPKDRLSDGGIARLLLFPHRSARHYVRPLSPFQAQGQIDAGNFLVNDLRRYWAFAAALEMLDPSPLGALRARSLEALVRDVPSYEIGLTRDMSRSQVAAVVAALEREAYGPANGRAAGAQ